MPVGPALIQPFAGSGPRAEQRLELRDERYRWALANRAILCPQASGSSSSFGGWCH